MVSVYGMARSSLRGGEFLLLVLYLLLALLLQFFSLFVTLLVSPLSHLHCVFFDGPLYFLIFLVLWCSMFTMVLVVFISLFCLSYLFNFSFHPIKVTWRLLSYFLLLKEVFPRILEDLVSRKWSI